MTRTKKWDESSRTRCHGSRRRSKSWTSGPPAPPARTYPPIKFTWLIFLQYKILLGSKNLHIDQWTTSHFQKKKLYSAFWRENSRNHFNCSMVLAAPLQQGAESTREFGLLPSAAETIIGHQWWPGWHWYWLVPYTSTGRWPLVTIDTNSPPMLVVVGKSPNSYSKAFSESSKFWSRISVPAFPVWSPQIQIP